MNRHEFEVRYSEPQIRRTTWAYVRISLRRVMDRSGWLACGILLVVWFGLFMTGGNSWVIWVVPAIFSGVALVLVAAWRGHIRNALERLSRMKSPVAAVVADEEKLSITSDLGSVTMPWASFTESLDGPGALYLKAGKDSMIDLPTDGVDERALQFIREQIAAGQPKG